MPILFEKVITLKEQYGYGSKRLGMRKPHVQLSNSAYRFVYNGMQRDDEIAGRGNALDFGARMYDSRLGRWMSVDPLADKYPSLSPYNYANDNPIFFVDPDGKDGVAFLKEIDGKKTLDITATYYSELSLPTGTQEKVNAILNSYQGTVDFNGEQVQVQFNIALEATPDFEIDKYSNIEPDYGFMPMISNPDGLNPRGGVNLLKLNTNRGGFVGEGDQDKIMADLSSFGGDINGLASALAHEISHNIGFIHADGGIMKDQLKKGGEYVPNSMSKEGLQNFVSRIPEMTSSSSPKDFWRKKTLIIKMKVTQV